MKKYLISIFLLVSTILFALEFEKKLHFTNYIAEDDEQKANLNYELGIMNEELKRNTISNQYKKEALRLYKKLYKKTPNIEYKNRIKELEEK